jgi:signal transduction histidine kinase
VFLMIEVLKRELADEPRLAETMEDLDGMRRSLLETVGTMDRFLHAERFRKGKVQIRPSPLDLHTLLSEQVAQLAYQAKDKKIELKLDCDGHCKLVSDRDMLTLILQNVLSNAVKYTQKGGVWVEGRCGEDDKLLVTVRDSGPGIAADTLGKLFTPFTRGATHGQSGVGLGLSIAKQASELVGARVWAESTVGEGSTFFVQLPKELPKSAEPAKPAPSPSGS